MSGVLSLVPVSWRVAGVVVLLFALGLSCAFGAWQGYGMGHAQAKADGDAALAKEKADRESENAARALDVADAERKARERVETASARADTMEQKLIAAEAEHAKERAALTRRISDAANAAASVCAGLPAAWVREYNIALTGSGDFPLPGNAGTGLFADVPGTVPAPLSGLSSGSPLTSPADILAHARDYGGQCRRYARQVAGWQETLEAWKRIPR